MWHWGIKRKREKRMIIIMHGCLVVFTLYVRKPPALERPETNRKQCDKELVQRNDRRNKSPWNKNVELVREKPMKATHKDSLSADAAMMNTEPKRRGSKSSTSSPLRPSSLKRLFSRCPPQIDSHRFNMEHQMSHAAFGAQNFPNTKCIFHGTECIMCTKCTLGRQVSLSVPCNEFLATKWRKRTGSDYNIITISLSLICNTWDATHFDDTPRQFHGTKCTWCTSAALCIATCDTWRLMTWFSTQQRRPSLLSTAIFPTPEMQWRKICKMLLILYGSSLIIRLKFSFTSYIRPDVVFNVRCIVSDTSALWTPL